MSTHVLAASLALVLSIASAAADSTNATAGDEGFFNSTRGNALWSGLLQDCKVPTMSCVQKNAFNYLDSVLKYNGDVSVASWLRFKKNSLHYDANHVDEEPEIEGRAMSPIEEVAGALKEKSVAFMMTHDVEMQLPDMLFEGATLKISPRSIEDNGLVVKLDVTPRTFLDIKKTVGRIFLKKIKQMIKRRLLIALLAIIVVIKLLKIKFLFVAPVLLGVGTAKKVLLKVLLFLFPALTHLFKLCSYYHDSYHTKYHHHHHQIAHVHHLPYHHGHNIHHTVKPDLYKHEHDNFEFSGPGLGPEYISHRNTLDHTPTFEEDENELKSWGLDRGTTVRGQPMKPLTRQQIEMLAAQAEKEVMLKARLQKEQLKLRQENVRLQEQLRQELKMQEQLKIQALMYAKQKAATTQVQAQAFSKAQEGAVYDHFYSPILQKIDSVFGAMNMNDEPCRERLVCNMYKNPVKFSPHSNLISAELSRDPDELQKPTDNNRAAVRFYRYVQAARDGQDMRECARLYPSCPINMD